MAGLRGNRWFVFAVIVAVIAKRRAVEVKADSYQQEYSTADKHLTMPWPKAGTLDQQRRITFTQLNQDFNDMLWALHLRQIGMLPCIGLMQQPGAAAACRRLTAVNTWLSECRVVQCWKA
jgi:hypothetical protein